MKTYHKISLGILLFLVTTLQAAPANVLVSIKPLQGIVTAIIGEAGQTLLPDNASPHHYALKPSDRDKLDKATIFIFVDYNLESFLNEKHLTRIPHVIHIGQLPDIHLLPARQQKQEAHHHDHPDHHHHDHHHDTATDWHLWLDVENAEVIARALTAKLSEIDPSSAKRYQQNFEQFQKELALLDSQLHSQLSSLSAQPVMVYHDSYQYLEKRYHLAPAAILHAKPQIPLTPKQMARIQDKIKTDHITCLFLEPEFDNPKIKQLGESLGLQIYSLDPLGGRLKNDGQLYFKLLQDVANARAQCKS